jgi:DNA-directed RNA polymerase subunit M/transcription elongation factor TFIIS
MGFSIRYHSGTHLPADQPTDEPRLGDKPEGPESQINIPPTGQHRLWKVIAAALRCPACGSTRHKAHTGKRINADGLLEQYRQCESCGVRFRAVFE